MDKLDKPELTYHVGGHQWYWTYDTVTPDNKTISFDSYMINEDDLAPGALRLLEVDNRLTVPAKIETRLLISADDVLHSWAVPSLGVKLDACAGRLNQVSLNVNQHGAYYGQCSELCGINHSFMPIVVEAVTADQYLAYVENTAE